MNLMTPISRNSDKKDKMVHKSHTGKRHPNLKFFDEKRFLKHLEAIGENQFENGVEMNLKPNFKKNLSS